MDKDKYKIIYAYRNIIKIFVLYRNQKYNINLDEWMIQVLIVLQYQLKTNMYNSLKDQKLIAYQNHIEIKGPLSNVTQPLLYTAIIAH